MELPVGSSCFYRTRDGRSITAKILKVHYEELPPYYTITVENSDIERQTVREKLRPVSEGPWPCADRQQPPRVARKYSSASIAALTKLAKTSPDACALFRQIDTDGDGAITIRELCAHPLY